MRFKSLAIKGAVPFPELTEICIPEKRKVALIGDNGAGKSTVFDCIFAAIYGDVTKPNGIYSLFKGSKEGMIDLIFDMKGREYRIKRLIDGVGRKQKPWFYVDGQPITEGKVAEFETAVQTAIGVSKEAFLASVYNCQTQKGNPLSLNDRERRDLLTEVLGLGQFDGPYNLACEADTETGKAFEKLKLEASYISASMGDIPALDAEKNELDQEISTLEKQIGDIDAETQKARQAMADAKANAQNLEELKRQIQVSESKITSIEGEKKAILEKIQKNQTELLGKADAIRAAVTETEKLKAEQATFEGFRADAFTKAESISREHSASLKVDRDALTAQRETLTLLEKARQAKEQQRTRLETQLEGLETQVSNLQSAASTLDAVPCKDTPMHGTCPLLAHANESKSTVAAKQAEIQAIKSALDSVRIDLAPEQAQKQKVAALAEALEAKEAIDPSREYWDKAEAFGKQITLTTKRIQDLAELVKNAPYLDGVEERIAGYNTELDRLEISLKSEKTALEEAQRKLSEASTVTTTISTLEAKVLELEGSKGNLQKSRDEKVSAVAVLLSKIDATQAAMVELEKNTEKQREVVDRLCTLQVLREGLGPKGARALKIDAAGPEISELVNALLRECYGQKFTIAIKTLRELTSKDGEMRECLEFAIIDNETGEETPVENKSGGEQQLIKEVISLGLCIYQRRRAGVDTRTIIRDESCSALTEENTQRYVKMLDRACEIGGFDQVLFVSHKSCAQAMADAVIAIENGNARVVEG